MSEVMASELTQDRFPELRNIPVFTADGEEIGRVGDAYYDEDSGRLESVGIAADALGVRRVMVPAQGATLRDDGLYLRYTRDQLEGSPDFGDEDLDTERYQQMRQYYGTPDYDTSGEGSVTRSEEELEVGTRPTERGSVRLRKWVETEPVEMDVELQRETARVTREAVDQPVSDAEIGEAEIEVPLEREEAVVQKQTVAKERVGIEKDVETTRETVTDELRKERVELEGDDIDVNRS